MDEVRKRGMANIKSLTGPIADGTEILGYDDNRARVEFYIYQSGAAVGRVSPYAGANPPGHASGWNSQFLVAFDRELHGDIVCQAWYAFLPTAAPQWVLSIVETPYES